MGKTITKKITNVELVRVEKYFNNPAIKQEYFYNFYFDNETENPLIVSNPNNPLPYDLVGHKIKYKLNDDNEVESFELL